MMEKTKDDQYSDEETARRRDEALLRALSTPPKRHSEMKVGKRKAKASRHFQIVFDMPEFAQSIAALSAPALERLIYHLGDDISRLPFDIFIRNLAPAIGADGTDKIIIGFRLRTDGELFTAA